MVECAGLENRYGCKLIVGSNPTPSAIYLDNRALVRGFLFSAHRNIHRPGALFPAWIVLSSERDLRQYADGRAKPVVIPNALQAGGAPLATPCQN